MLRRPLAPATGSARVFELPDRPAGAGAVRDLRRPAAPPLAQSWPLSPLAWPLQLADAAGRPARSLATLGEALSFVEEELGCDLARASHWRHARTYLSTAAATPDDDELLFHATRVLEYAMKAEGFLVSERVGLRPAADLAAAEVATVQD